jgi:hypothetical protein
VKSAEIRTVAPDELWLSPAYERDVFGVHFTWQPDAAAVTALVEAIEAAVQPFHPGPRWAKVFGGAHPWSQLYRGWRISAGWSGRTTRVASSEPLPLAPLPT